MRDAALRRRRHIRSATWSKQGARERLLTLPWRGRDERSSLSGSARIARSRMRDGVGCETGWGESLAYRTVPELKQHPTLDHISLRSCDPTHPLQGRVTHH